VDVGKLPNYVKSVSQLSLDLFLFLIPYYSSLLCTVTTSIVTNIYDLGQWKNIDAKLRDLLVENGSIRYNNINFPKDENFRHFSNTSYIRKLSNEQPNRK
jgi:hypothetical protein